MPDKDGQTGRYGDEGGRQMNLSSIYKVNLTFCHVLTWP